MTEGPWNHGMVKIVIAACGAIGVATQWGCSSPDESVAETVLAPGAWRGTIAHFERELPFNFDVVQGEETTMVYLINGPERMPVEELVLSGDRVEMNFPSYGAGLSAELTPTGMAGEIFFTRRDSRPTFPFTATAGPSHRFFERPAEEFADFSGRWEVTLEFPAFNFSQQAIALFEQERGKISGTVQTQVGDFRFIAGEVRGKQLFMSAYDGGYTQLWLAEADAEGALKGSFDSVTYGPALWNARRNDDVRLDDPLLITALKPGTDRFDFTFPDMEGEPVSLSDPRYSGKVVLVVLAGSWCPTCHDEAVFMSSFYPEFKALGLEVVYLMFEYSDQFAEVEEQVRAFAERYDVSHDVLFAGDAARSSRGSLLPQLNNIVAFPTTIFVDRNGEVRRIYTSFPGPATGAEHERYKREFRAFTRLLLDESTG